MPRNINMPSTITFGVYTYVLDIFLSMFYALSIVTVSVVGYKFGAGEFEEIKSVGKNGTLLVLVSGVVMTAAAMGTADKIAWLYLGSDAAAWELTTEVLRLCSLAFLLYGVALLVSAFFTGLEESTTSAVIAVTQSLALPAIFIFLLPELFGAGAIWLSIPASTLVASILAMVLMARKWKRL